ncbi:SPOR domain-containing protein [Cereibacter sphaeroides]|uniref:SPOR domain-containing protein n=1 Tax=Cereibacter sphaeroides TaxID=1063 RepID=UPI000191C4A5|nr:SPOR domain-containing protein [Cereibacter sphaeroides]ACM02859.1 Sporulation domain protein precursor [Cereibacter sphaeroides KD131]
MLIRAVSAAICALVAGAGAVPAQDGPAETPPSDFVAPQYVDSEGCVFLRAGVEGAVSWVPRVTRDRKPLCGYPPSLSPVVEASPEDAPAVAADATTAAPQADAPAMTAEAGLSSDPAAKAAAKAAIATVAAAVARPETDRPAKTWKKRTRFPAVRVQPADAAEALALDRLTLGPDEIRPASDMPDEVLCPSAVPQPRRFAIKGGGSTVLCIRPGRGLEQARVPRLPATEMALLARQPRTEAPAGSYVQVGAFLDPANARSVRQSLAALGLPAAVAEGGALEIVLAGPFTEEASARAALRRLRGTGFRDAFLR